MCGNMVYMQSPTAEIRREKKKERKKKSQGKNIMSASATQGGHKNNANVPANTYTKTNTTDDMTKILI